MRRQSVRKIKSRFCLIVLIMFISITSYAQTKRITGKVTTSEDARPVIGATVKEKSTSVSAVSDINGDYSIYAKAGVLFIFSYVGVQSKEVTVGGDISVFYFSLCISANTLNEVV